MTFVTEFDIGVTKIDLDEFTFVAEQADSDLSQSHQYFVKQSPIMYLVLTFSTAKSTSPHIRGRWVDAEEFWARIAQIVGEDAESVRQIRTSLETSSQVDNVSSQQLVELYYRLSVLRDRLVDLSNWARRSVSGSLSEVKSFEDRLRRIRITAEHFGSRLLQLPTFATSDKLQLILQKLKADTKRLSDLLASASPLRNDQALVAAIAKKAVDEKLIQIVEIVAEVRRDIANGHADSHQVVHMDKLFAARKPAGTWLSEGFDEEKHIQWIQLRGEDWRRMQYEHTCAILKYVFDRERTSADIKAEVTKFRTTAFIFDRDRQEMSNVGREKEAKFWLYIELWECNRLSSPQIAEILDTIDIGRLVSNASALHDSAEKRLANFSDARLRKGKKGKLSAARLPDDLMKLLIKTLKSVQNQPTE